MAVLVGVAAFTVDIGMQRVARRDMQAIADVVALDLSRELNGRPVATLQPLMPALATASLQRQGETLGSTPTLDVELGKVDSTGVFTVMTGTSTPSAVRVKASTEVDFAFGISSRGGANRTATAAAAPGACIKIGSSALDLNSGNSALLGPILADALNISALSYTGIAGLGVSLGDLALALGVGSTDELLATTVTLDEFYTATAQALANDDDPSNDGAISVFEAAVNQSSGSVQAAPVTVGQLISVGAGDSSALSSNVDVLGLLTGAAYIANGTNALAIPGLVLPAGITASLFVTEAPKQACNSGTASTSQLKVELKQTLPVIGAFGINVASIDITVALELAKAVGGIASVTCTDGVATALVGRLDQSTLATLTANVKVKLLGLSATDANIPTTVPAAGAGGTFAMALPQYYDAPFHTPQGAGVLGIPNVNQASLSVLGINLGLVGGLVVGVLNPALGILSGLLVNTISPLLGLRLAGADLFPLRTAECLNPKLVG